LKCVFGGKPSFSVGRDLFVIFRLVFCRLSRKGLEDRIWHQGPRIIVEHLIVKGKQCQRSPIQQPYGAHIYNLGEKLNCASECMT
jgi:hypothetical protein